MDIVDQETWLAARLELLVKEKTLSRLRDEVAWILLMLPINFWILYRKGETIHPCLIR